MSTERPPQMRQAGQPVHPYRTEAIVGAREINKGFELPAIAFYL